MLKELTFVGILFMVYLVILPACIVKMHFMAFLFEFYNIAATMHGVGVHLSAWC